METNFNQENIDAVLKQTALLSEELAKKQNKAYMEIGSSAGGAIGSIIPVVGTAVGALVGGAIGAVASFAQNLIKKGNTAWSKFGDSDKENLIQGLIVDAVWVKGLQDVQQVKSHILNTFVAKGVLPKKDEEVNKFFPNNLWALNRIQSEVQKSKDLQALIESVNASLNYAVSQFKMEERKAIAFNAISKAKQGKPITELEATKILELQDEMKTITAIKRKKGLI